jgi:hypothetical protein
LAVNLLADIEQHGRHPRDHVIRLAHEMNGDWYHFAVCSDVVAFKAAWSRIVGIIRGTAGLEEIKFEFSPAKPYFNYQGPFSPNFAGRTPMNFLDAMPDPDDFDICALSLHDRAPDTTSLNTWLQAIGNNPSDLKIDLEELRTSCRSIGKPYGVSEWSTSYDRDDNPATPPPAIENECEGEGDKPRPDLFNQYSYEWFDAQDEWLAYELHLTGGCYTVWDNATMPTVGPAGKAKYIELWNQN